MATVGADAPVCLWLAEGVAVMQRCRVFKSARSPVRFVFNAASGPAGDADGTADGPSALQITREPIQMIFKSGDDLRQDQFVCQVCVHVALLMYARPCHAHTLPELVGKVCTRSLCTLQWFSSGALLFSGFAIVPRAVTQRPPYIG